jgi:peptide/nickel transport system substrate-binding protein
MRKREVVWILVLFMFGTMFVPTGTLMAKEQLVVALKGEPDDGYDPVMGWGRYGHSLFYSTLLTRNGELDIVNDLAVSRELSADGLRWTVHIRTDVLFSDGTPLTTEDVAFTFNRAAFAGGKADLSRLEKAVATGPDTVEFHLKRPDSTFESRMVTLGIVPSQLYGDDFDRHPVGSGPFVMVSWVEGEQMIAAPNPLYYGEKPHFKRIVFLYGEEDTMFAAAKAGQVDLVVVPPWLGVQKVSGMHVHAVKSVDHRGLMFPTVPDTGKKTEEGSPIGNNVTSDTAIRKAVNKAIDRKALVAGVLEGFGNPAYFACDLLPWNNPENEMADNDIAGAKKLLLEGGWQDSDGDGVLEKDGIEAAFTIVYPAGDSVRQGLALAVAGMLKPVGLKVTVDGKSWDEINMRRHRDVVVYGWGSYDPLSLYNIHHSSLAGQSSYNPGFYNNPVVDAYLEKAVGALSSEEAVRYWQLAQWDGETGCGPRGDAPWAWLVDLEHVYFVSDQLDIGDSRLEPHGTGWPITANITQWTWRE